MLSETDQAKVNAAVAEAELASDGEIVTIVAGRSDAYHDVGLHWALLAMLLVLALVAWQPGPAEWLYGWVTGDPWGQVPAGALLTIALVLMTLTFLLVRVALAKDALRLALTPPGTRTRRVRRRALLLFRASTERRTTARTGVLLYLSLAEHRAEIVADESIHSKVAPEVWGAAMAALVAAVRDGRTGDGMAEAVTQIGKVLAEHFPRSPGDTNELPDRLILL
jgi:putative membrane protein